MNTSYVNQWINRFKAAGKPTEGAAATGPISVPLYIAGAVVQSAGLAAVSFQLGQLNFAAFTIGLTLLGAFVSYQLRRAGTPTRLLKSGTFLLGLIFLYALRGAGIFGALVPPEEVGSQEMLLVSALAFTATFASFLLITDDAVIFTCVWAIAMIGLTGTVNINRELPVCFVVFLAAASFLLVHQNALSFGGTRLLAPHLESDDSGTVGGLLRRHLPAPHWSLLRTHLLMAGAAWLMALILGVLIAIPVQMVGRNMSLGTIIQRLKVPPAPVSRGFGVQRLVFDNPTQFNVGLGPVDDDPSERLSVWSNRPQYWRGRTYDVYSGHGWTSSFLDRPPAQEANTQSPPSDGIYTFDLSGIYAGEETRRRTERISNTFHISAGVYGPLYHAADAKRVRAPLVRLFIRPDHTLAGGRAVNTDYDIDSDVSVARPSDLRRSPAVYPQRIIDQYTGIGPYYSDSLRELTDEAIAGFGKNPYDKASAIRRFVASRCTYTQEARAVPRDQDAVDFFLNESKEGYCDLYATAMAVLCRYAGLPARVVTGFAPGLPAENDTEPKPGGPNDKRTRYVLRGTDQHSWTEVYFSGYGWIVFDATIDTGGTTPTARTPPPLDRAASGASLWQRRLPLVLTGLAVLTLLFVVVNEWRGRNRADRTTPSAPNNRNAAAVYRTYDGAVRRLRRWGVRGTTTATTGEYLAGVRGLLGPTAADSLEPLTRLTEKALYGPAAVTETDVAAARAARAQLDAALRQTPRKPRSNG